MLVSTPASPLHRHPLVGAQAGAGQIAAVHQGSFWAVRDCPVGIGRLW